MLCIFLDIEQVIRMVSVKTLQGVTVTAEKVQESDAILVQGLLLL